MPATPLLRATPRELRALQQRRLILATVVVIVVLIVAICLIGALAMHALAARADASHSSASSPEMHHALVFADPTALPTAHDTVGA